MNLAPIVLFVYKRLWHTQQTIESLRRNSLANESDLYIFSDGPKNSKEEPQVSEIRKYIKSISGFKNVIIEEKSKNFGLANSVITGVSQIIVKFNKVIVVEDDLISSPNFLKFMNEALDFYENDSKIFSISGYSFPIEIPDGYKQNIYVLPRSSSWGWATWLDRWRKVDWEVKDYGNFIKDKYKKKIFSKGGDDLIRMMQNKRAGKIDSWSIIWTYTHFKNAAFCIYPLKSFVKNIGTDKSGVHSKKTKKYEVKLAQKDFKISFVSNIKPNEEILKSLRRFFKKNFLRLMIHMIFIPK